MIALVEDLPQEPKVLPDLRNRVFVPLKEAKPVSQDSSFFQRIFARPSVFFSMVFLLTFLQIKWLLNIVSLEPGTIFPYLWLGAFLVLSLNISVLATQALFVTFVKAPYFSKVDPYEVQSVPVALLYCIKNEPFGLKERISYTLEGNSLQHLHLWILSDSNDSFGKEEENLVNELQKGFGRNKVFYRRRAFPQERKQGNIKDWLMRWGASYDYFIVCDADSLLPHGWVEELLRIAEHPNQGNIGIFQSAIYIAHEASFYSRMQAIAQFYAQKLYFHVNQAVFGHSIAFGHNCLIRREAFETIELPRNLLSHDNWETALLERNGYKTVCLSDIVSFEEASPHYLEERKRSKRWLKGTLQGWPLLFLPGISCSTRFLIFYQIYLYLVQPILCFWILSTLLVNTTSGNQVFLSGKDSFLLLGSTLGVLLFHKMVVARNLGDIKRIVQETIFSTLLGLQNIFYGTLDLIILPFERLGWTPMAKNPNAHVSLSDCFKNLFVGTMFGIFLLWVGLNQSTEWTLFTLPILLSLIFSIPLVYFSSIGFALKRKKVMKEAYPPWNV